MIRLVAGAATDVGQIRTLNEDGFLVAESLFAVADGMGGHRGGEVASAEALAAFRTGMVEATADDLVAAVQALGNADISLDDIALRRPTLDDVFLTLTGHTTEWKAFDDSDGDGADGDGAKKREKRKARG